MEFALGHFLDLNLNNSTSTYKWQNFWLNDTVDGYSFIPFGFSGLTTNRQGDNIDAILAFPNNEVSRPWAVNAAKDTWVAKVQVIRFTDSNVTDKSQRTVLTTYIGQVSSVIWDEASLRLNLNTLLDAVGADVPARRISQDLVGYIPTSSNIQLF